MKITKRRSKEGWTAEIIIPFYGNKKSIHQAVGKTELGAVERLLKDLYSLYVEVDREADKRHNAMLKAMRILDI